LQAQCWSSLLSWLKSTLLSSELQQQAENTTSLRKEKRKQGGLSPAVDLSLLPVLACGRERRDLPCTLGRSLPLLSCAHLVPGTTRCCDIHGISALRSTFCTRSVIRSEPALYINLTVTIVSSGGKEIRNLSL